MVSFPALFFALSGAALIGALAAIWNSLRVALGGGERPRIATSRDLPDHAALVEEKNALLRAIKDLEYEHAVGKTSEADFQRLDAAYRARAKQVLSELDRDVRPLYEQAERLIDAHVAGVEERKSRRGADKKSEKRQAAAEKAAAEKAAAEKAAAEKSAPARDADAGAAGERVAEARASEREGKAAPSLDEIVAAIRAGEVTEAPEAPADWPAEARRFFDDAIRRALAETRRASEESPASREEAASDPADVAAGSEDER